MGIFSVSQSIIPLIPDASHRSAYGATLDGKCTITSAETAMGWPRGVCGATVRLPRSTIEATNEGTVVPGKTAGEEVGVSGRQGIHR